MAALPPLRVSGISKTCLLGFAMLRLALELLSMLWPLYHPCKSAGRLCHIQASQRFGGCSCNAGCAALSCCA